MTQATFWTTTAPAGTTSFSFYAGGCAGAAAGGAASAVAAYYSGVDTTGASPIDQSAVPGSPPIAGTTLTAPPLTTTNPDDELVSLFATGSAFNAPTPTYTNTSTAWANSGIDNTLQQVAGVSAAVTAQTTASAAWTAQTIALKPLLSSSITVAPPAGYVAGDFLLVSIAVQNLGSGAICAPTDATWTPVPVSATNTVSQGTLTQEAFWTTGVSTGTFAFYPSSSCTGTPVAAAASAAAVYYTGVDPTTPLDGVAPQGAQDTTSQLQPTYVSTNTANDEVVSLFASNSTFNIKPTVAYTSSTIVNTGLSAVGRPTAGLYTPLPVSSSAAAAWTAETIALKPDSTMTSVTIARPPNPTASDFVLVTVTANGLPSPDRICAPSDGSWTQVGTTLTQPASGGTLAQASFFSFRGTTNPEIYQFSFRTGSCPSGGSLVSAPASAIAVRYTGVNPIIPIDVSNQTSGTGTTVAPLAVTPTYANDALVGLYGTAATSFTSGIPAGHSVSGASTATAFTAVTTPAPAAGVAVSPASAKIASNNWIGQTVALEAEAGGCNNCEYGLEVPTPSSYDTNYALPITAAFNALQAQNMVRPADNAIILLSDGDANTAGTNPCQAGIVAAENAESAPYDYLVYVIAYGAITDSSGCAEDSSDLAPVNYDNHQGLTPQCALELMVDNHVTNPGHTDAQIAASICSDSRVTSIPGFNRFYGEANDSSLEQSFQQVGFSLTSPRLLSNNATSGPAKGPARGIEQLDAVGDDVVALALLPLARLPLGVRDPAADRDPAAALEPCLAALGERVPGLEVDEDGGGVAVEAGHSEPHPAAPLAARGGVGLGALGEAADQADRVARALLARPGAAGAGRSRGRLGRRARGGRSGGLDCRGLDCRGLHYGGIVGGGPGGGGRGGLCGSGGAGSRGSGPSGGRGLHAGSALGLAEPGRPGRGGELGERNALSMCSCRRRRHGRGRRRGVLAFASRRGGDLELHRKPGPDREALADREPAYLARVDPHLALDAG